MLYRFLNLPAFSCLFCNLETETQAQYYSELKLHYAKFLLSQPLFVWDRTLWFQLLSQLHMDSASLNWDQAILSSVYFTNFDLPAEATGTISSYIYINLTEVSF